MSEIIAATDLLEAAHVADDRTLTALFPRYWEAACLGRVCLFLLLRVKSLIYFTGRESGSLRSEAGLLRLNVAGVSERPVMIYLGQGRVANLTGGSVSQAPIVKALWARQI